MTPSERINYIKSISDSLITEDWDLIDLTLKQFELPWSAAWSGSKQSYLLKMLEEANDGDLLELAKHLGLASELQSTDEPEFWNATDARLFLSHLAKIKVEAAALQVELAKFGITAFVAHQDIEPTKEWQTEIESALASMDGLVALLSPGIKESNWCDQEVGVAIGRKLPVISVKLDTDPYGFIGKYQAVNGKGKSAEQLAKELFDLFLPNPHMGPKITGALVRLLSEAGSFQDAKRITNLIGRSSYLTSKHTTAMKQAIEKNGQVAGAWGVPEKINQIAEAVER